MIDFSSVIKAVSSFAPTVGSALAGPIGGIVGDLVAKLFGGNAQEPDDLVAKINADPDAAIKLKKLEYEHQEVLAKYKADQVISDNADVADARDRDEKIIQDASAPNAGKVVSIIALVPHMITLLTGFSIVFIASLRLFDHNANINDTLLTMIVGQLFVIFSQQCKFYFGNGIKKV